MREIVNLARGNKLAAINRYKELVGESVSVAEGTEAVEKLASDPEFASSSSSEGIYHGIEVAELKELALLAREQKVEAVRVYRELASGVSLAQAKERVEKLAADPLYGVEGQLANSSKSGCLSLIVVGFAFAGVLSHYMK